MKHIPASEWMALLIERHVHADKAALIEADTGLAISYAGLHARVLAIADAFTDQGVLPGDLIFVVSYERIDLVALLLAALKVRAVVANVNVQLGSADYSRLLVQMRPQWLILDPSVARFAEACQDAGWNAARPLAGTGFEQRPAWARQPREGEAAICLFTSGSTGMPKPVLHSVSDLLQTNRHYAAEVLGLGPHDVLFSASKMSFAYGLNSVHFALFHGATAVLAPKQPVPEALCDSITAHGVSVFFSVPTVFRLLLKKTPERLGALTSVRSWVSAGETMPRQLCDMWAAATGREAIDGIGTTETLSTFISNRKGAVVRGSAGREVSGFEFALRTEQGALAAPGQWGTLHVRGATIARGYWNDAETTATYFKDGWFRTNDVFYQDEDGNYFFVGRANDVFKSGANWISPVRIELVLQQHPEVLDCAIAPVIEMDGLNRIKAFIVVRKERSDDGWKKTLADELSQFSRERLARYEYPHFIEFIAELPRGVNGKLQRAQLRT